MKKSSTFLKTLARSRFQWMLLAISLIGSLVVAVSFLAKSEAGIETLTPFASDALVDSVGIVAHLGYADTPYGQNWRKADPSQDVKALLTDLGVRHVRDSMAHPTLQPYRAYTRPRVAQLYRDDGIRFITVLDTRTNGILDATQIGAYVDEYANGAINLDGETFNVRELLEAIEGSNEYDQANHPEQRDPNWVQNLKNYQSVLYRQVKATPLLSDLPVVMPSLVYTKYCTDVLGSFAGSIDDGNLHLYPNYPYFIIPTGNIDWHFSNGQNCYQDKPIYVTETGYQTGGGGITDRTIAKYLSRLLPEFFSRPQIKRTYVYSLIDTLPESGLWGLIRPERNGQKIGGFDQFTLTPKLSYHAVKSLLDLLREGEWVKAQRKWMIPTVNLKPVEILFDGKQDSTHHLLLQKSTGDYFLLLWQEVESFNPKAGNFDAPVDEVSVSLPQGYRFKTLYQYDAGFRLTPSELATANTNTITIQVPDRVMVLHFTS